VKDEREGASTQREGRGTGDAAVFPLQYDSEVGEGQWGTFSGGGYHVKDGLLSSRAKARVRCRGSCKKQGSPLSPREGGEASCGRRTAGGSSWEDSPLTGSGQGEQKAPRTCGRKFLIFESFDKGWPDGEPSRVVSWGQEKVPNVGLESHQVDLRKDDSPEGNRFFTRV